MQTDSLGEESPKTLSRGACKPNLNGVRRKTVRTKLFGNHRTQHRPGGAIGISDWHLNQDRFPMRDRRSRQFNQEMIEFAVQFMILFPYFPRNIVRGLLVKQFG